MIVVSEFTKLLDMVHGLIIDQGFQVARLDGSMGQEER